MPVALSEVIIHDAAELLHTPLARIKLPTRAPFGFHCSWSEAAAPARAVAVRDADA